MTLTQRHTPVNTQYNISFPPTPLTYPLLKQYDLLPPSLPFSTLNTSPPPPPSPTVPLPSQAYAH